MAAIVLAALNARHAHPSLGLRCLLANLGELRPQAALVEAAIGDDLGRVAERILAHRPRIVGLSAAIWNRVPTVRLIRLLRAADAGLRVVVGGPEATHAAADDPLARAADVVVAGDGDLVFAPLCRDLLAGAAPPARIAGGAADLDLARLPWDEYADADLAHRQIGIEATRGCVYSCEFCLSSLDRGVRGYPLADVLAGLDRLIARGCRTFRFVDRTFNLDPERCRALLGFLLDRWPRDAAGERIGCARPVEDGPGDGGFFVHCEMVPDRLIPPLVELLPRFPAGGVQLEIGVQSMDPEVTARISRRQDPAKVEATIGWLRRSTGCHLHVDLIAGLPGEGLAGFCAGFDRLYRVAMDPAGGRPADLQVGILKLLPGTPIVRHREAFGMVFDPEPPYEILASRDLDFATLLRLKRFARWIELTANRHRYDRALAALAAAAISPSAAFLGLADALSARFGREHAIHESDLYAALLDHLRGQGIDAAPLLAADWLDIHPDPGRHLRGVPPALAPAVERALQRGGSASIAAATAVPKRS